LYQIQCFRVNILKNCSMFSISQCFSIFSNFPIFSNFFQFFLYFFGQKGRLNYYFRTKFTLLIIKKSNMGLNICLHWTIFCYLKMLTIFEKISTLNRIQCWNFEKHWHRIEFQCSFFWHWKHWIKINVNVCADPKAEQINSYIFV
jgi:hypothetical protein